MKDRGLPGMAGLPGVDVGLLASDPKGLPGCSDATGPWRSFKNVSVRQSWEGGLMQDKGKKGGGLPTVAALCI